MKENNKDRYGVPLNYKIEVYYTRDDDGKFQLDEDELQSQHDNMMMELEKIIRDLNRNQEK
jgi:hypothetical protein